MEAREPLEGGHGRRVEEGAARNAAASKRDCGARPESGTPASRTKEGSCEGSSCCNREHALRCRTDCRTLVALEPVKTSHSTQPKEKTSHAGAATRSPFWKLGDVYSARFARQLSPNSTFISKVGARDAVLARRDR